jgi:hypothetical protein
MLHDLGGGLVVEGLGAIALLDVALDNLFDVAGAEDVDRGKVGGLASEEKAARV